MEEKTSFRLPAPDELCAVVVTYNPDLGFGRRLQQVSGQAGRVVIIDNASAAPARRALQSVVEQVRADLILNDQNLGLGAALNQGVDRARAEGFEWVLTLDQDTSVSDSASMDLITALRACPFRQRVGMVGSTVMNFPEDRPKGLWEERDALITSGSLLSVAVFKVVGPFREDLFIDYVDVEWCLRARARGYRMIVTSTPTILHRIGDPRAHRFFGRRVLSSHHRPFRRYYMMRNRIILWKEFFRSERRYLLRDAKYLAKDTVKIFLYEEEKMSQFRNLCAGIRDGVLNRTGRRHADTQSSAQGSSE